MWVPDVVDPRPLIEERLSAVAIEHEPRIKALEHATAEASSSNAWALKKELRRARRAYRVARREIRRLHGQGVVW
jgi:hypothetical protein